MDKDKDAALVNAVEELESLENKIHNVPLVFAEMFKDEINANDEVRLYNGVKRVLKKYSEQRAVLAALDEFTSVVSGGASLKEILMIVRDEAIHPTAATEISVDTARKRRET